MRMTNNNTNKTRADSKHSEPNTTNTSNLHFYMQREKRRYVQPSVETRTTRLLVWHATDYTTVPPIIWCARSQGQLRVNAPVKSLCNVVVTHKHWYILVLYETSDFVPFWLTIN